MFHDSVFGSVRAVRAGVVKFTPIHQTKTHLMAAGYLPSSIMTLMPLTTCSLSSL